MNRLRVISLIDKLKSVIYDLEAELKSDPKSYLPPTNLDYEEILNYYNYGNDDDEEGL